jgi:hypothetical protein
MGATVKVKRSRRSAWPDGPARRKAKNWPPIPRNELTRRLLAIAASMPRDLPSDWAEQHDYYIHGTPKRPKS